ncbi:AaceriABR087Cp [[Ashbya] aceris (nom. inval.)]|nr:AaceriABR087Cp [[Ashbya] aceris (nom. inval.)]
MQEPSDSKGRRSSFHGGSSSFLKNLNSLLKLRKSPGRPAEVAEPRKTSAFGHSADDWSRGPSVRPPGLVARCSTGSVYRSQSHRRQGSSSSTKREFKPSHSNAVQHASQCGNCMLRSMQPLADSPAERCSMRGEAFASPVCARGTENKTVPPYVYDSRLPASAIPCHMKDSSTDQLPRISVDVLAAILDGKFSSYYCAVYIIDCRFEYEFQAGHIKNAINVSSRRDLEAEFIQKRMQRCSADPGRPPLLVFHCEYSSYRGPIIAAHLRNYDRMLNHDQYPRLHYPDIVVLEGGFKSFIDAFPGFCQGHYVGMDSCENHELELARFKRDSKTILTRQNSQHIFQEQGQEGGHGSIGRPHAPDVGLGSLLPTRRPSFSFDAPPQSPSLAIGANSGSSACSCSSSTRSVLTGKMLLMHDLTVDVKACDKDDQDDQFSFDLDDELAITVGDVFSSPVGRRLFPEIVKEENDDS